MHSVTEIRNGNYAAFDEAYQTMHIKVFRFFLKRVQLHNVAEDLTQQCFIRLWQYRNSLSEEHTLDKQLFVMAHSLLINHFRRQATEKEYKTTLSLQYPLEPYTDPDERFARKDQLEAALVHLPPVRQKVLILRLVHGYSNKEIADQLSVSVKTVEDHILKAVRSMKKVITLVWLLGALHTQTPIQCDSSPHDAISHIN